MNLTKKVKSIARKDFDLVGIITPEKYNSYRRKRFIESIKEMVLSKTPSRIMPNVKSIIVLGFHIWDEIFDMAVLKEREEYYLYDLVMVRKTYELKKFLRDNGYEAKATFDIDLKKAAMLAGLGCFGKNTMIVNPMYGPWIRLIAVLSTAGLNPDHEFSMDLCENCERCIKACPKDVLSTYDFNECLVMAYHRNQDLELAVKYSPRLTQYSFIYCNACQRVCPIGGLK